MEEMQQLHWTQLPSTNSSAALFNSQCMEEKSLTPSFRVKLAKLLPNFCLA